MNREILFRGKRVDNGEWVIGDLVRRYKEDGTVSYIRVQKVYKGYEYAQVDPATVGQYAGRRDQNGAEIFEWDIINDDEFGYLTVEWDEERNGYILENDEIMSDFESVYGGKCEVCGNIFDSPELLEGGVDNGE